MRIALLTDLHANLEALVACLEHARSLGADQRVYLGDLVGYGADPGPVMDIVAEGIRRGDVAVLGNHDAAVSRAISYRMSIDAQLVVEWTRGHLTGDHLALLGSLPLFAEQGGRLYVHANAWAPEKWEYVLTGFDAGRSMRASPWGLTFCGHVHTPALYHMASDGRVSAFEPVPGVAIPVGPQRRWLGIPGSAGQPRDGNPAACYALFDDATRQLTYFRVPYDHEAAARKIAAAGLPTTFDTRLVTGG
jgi:diadenosine tetraphosphatase ApaH/serine/threonine PP2A family protein phosphatase